MKIIHTLLCFFLLVSPALANESQRKITVTGKSEVTLQPEYSIIYTDLRFLHPEITTSYQKLQQALVDVINELKQLGITDKDITKSIIRQGTEYTWRNNTKVHAGFFASCSMHIRVNDIENIHMVYNRLSKYNSLAITRTKYGVNNIEQIRTKETLKALQIAREKAKSMAHALDVTLGDVLQISETILPQGPAPIGMMRSDAAPEKPGGTFGSVTVSAYVQVEFMLK